jgi:hypothetical protein
MDSMDPYSKIIYGVGIDAVGPVPASQFPSGADQLARIKNDLKSKQIATIDLNVNAVWRKLSIGDKSNFKIRNELQFDPHMMALLVDHYIAVGWIVEIQHSRILMLTPSKTKVDSLPATMFDMYFNLCVAEAAKMIASTVSLQYEYKLSWDVANELEHFPNSPMVVALKTFFIANKWKVQEVLKHANDAIGSKYWVLQLNAQ